MIPTRDPKQVVFSKYFAAPIIQEAFRMILQHAFRRLLHLGGSQEAIRTLSGNSQKALKML